MGVDSNVNGGYVIIDVTVTVESLFARHSYIGAIIIE